MNDKSYNLGISDQEYIARIGKYVKEMRLKSNLSQNIVSKRAGVSRSTISLIERGETISLTSLMRILRTIDQLHVLDVFKINQQISPVAYSKMMKKKRQRASTVEEDSVLYNNLGW